MNSRIIVLMILTIFLFSVLISRAVYVHLFSGSWLSQLASDQYEKSLNLSGRRGTIFDTNYRELAVTLEGRSIAAYPARVKDIEKISMSLSKILNLNFNRVKSKLQSNNSFVWIKRKISNNEKIAIKELKAAGIDFVPESTRYYPENSLACQVLGITGLDNSGLEGIEFLYNSYLKGKSTEIKVIQDALGQTLNNEKEIITEIEGNDLLLTVDRRIQYITERSLEENILKFSAQSGIVIVMEPKTGKILALAHYPKFNPNYYTKFDNNLWRNKAVTDSFEPGSIMKLFVAAAALESSTSSESTIFFAENGEYQIGKNIVYDNSAYGWLTLLQIIQYSSDIGTIKISEKLGNEILYNSLRNFGFGEKSDIDCPGETSGYLKDYRKWSEFDRVGLSIGKSLSVSAIQLVNAVSAIANDGILMKPFIVQEITNQVGNAIKKEEPEEIRRVISANTAKRLRNIMKTVVSKEGTGVKAIIEGYSICGITGINKKTDSNGNISEKSNTADLFISIAPADDPNVTILVVIYEPHSKYYGDYVAVSTFKEIASEIFEYLNIN